MSEQLVDCIKVGPWGGNHGDHWSFKPNGQAITNIFISYGDIIDGISFKGSDGHRKDEYFQRFGGSGGCSAEIVLDWPREFVCSISGSHGDYCGHRDLLTMLEFETNLGRKYGPYGIVDATPFSLSMEGGAIIGFHGRAGRYVNAIGIYATPTLRSCKEIGSSIVQ